MDEKRLQSVKGELLLLEGKNKRRQAVELWLLNDKTTENGGKYTDLAGHKDGFVHTPILIAYVGDKIGDGHNFVEKIDTNGEYTPSFMDAYSERIVGWFDKPEDLRIENKNGNEWIVGKGYINTWYARELTEKLRRQGAQGMSVSIETLVWNVKKENGVEVYDEYEILGTTILGDDVPPAVVGANIKILQALGAEQLKKMTIKVASAEKGAKTPKSKKGVDRMIISEVKAAFPDYKVLAVKDNNVVLLNKKNVVVLSTAEKDGDKVNTGKETEIALNASVVLDENVTIDVPVETIIEAATADYAELKRQCEEAKTQKDAALEALAKMQKYEKERRVQEVKAALLARAEEISRCEGLSVSSDDLAALTCEESLCKYALLEDEEGKFCGLAAAIKDLDTAAMSERLKKAKAQNNSKYAWDIAKSEPKTDANDVMSAAKRIMN